MKKTISLILCALMLLSIIPAGVISASASMVSESQEYDFGTKREGNSTNYYRFSLNQKSHISFSFSYTGNSLMDWNIYDTEGNTICKNDDITVNEKYNKTTGFYSKTFSRNIGKGIYYLEAKTWNSLAKYSFVLDAEATIKLSKGTLSSVKSPKKAQFVAKCKKATDAIGYQFQYSTNEQFKKGVKTVKSAVAQRTVKKLKSGKRYYVRVRPYTIYTDGTYVYGQYSLPKSVKIK